MAISVISSVTPDKAEYSAYYRQSSTGLDLNSMTVTVSATGTNGDTVYLSLMQQDTGRPVLANKTATLASGKATFTIDIFKDCHDSDNIFRARQGYYTLVASSLADRAGVTGSSAIFPIMAASAVEFREQWLRGIPLIDERNLLPIVQGLTGVAGFASRDVQRGGYALTWASVARTLSFDAGPTVVVPGGGNPYNVTLWNGTLDQTVTLTVTPTAMPGTDATGYVMVDYAPYDDHMLRQHLFTSYGELEHTLNVPPEPMQAVTDALRAKYPYAERTTGYPPTYRPNASARRGLRVQLPYRLVQVLHEFGGYYGGTKVLNVPAELLALDKLNGVVNFVPSVNSVYPAPTVSGFGSFALYGTPFMGLPQVIPNFWHFSCTYGLPDLTSGYQRIAREFLFRYAAVNVLQLIGRGRTDILAAESFSRDGGSLSRSFTNGEWGVYSDLIAMHLNWLQDSDTGGRKLKMANTGIEVSVAG